MVSTYNAYALGGQVRLGLKLRSGTQYSLHARQRFSIRIWDQYLGSRWKNFLFQCGLATVALVIILAIEDAVLRAAIVVAVASTVFTIFVFPNSVVSTPRKVIGGHVVAVIFGAIFSGILLLPGIDTAAADVRLIRDIAAAFAVGLSILLMVMTDTEHPPAAGTALGLVIHGLRWSPVLFILLSVITLSVVRLVLRPKLINLL